MWSQKIVDVTPEMAKRWLERHNVGNRPIRPGVVKRYVAMMKAGQWVTSPDGIIFGGGDRLLQGQHRLTAIVKSGVTCRMCVTRGVSNEAFKVLDRGAPRSVADVLGINKKLSEVARLGATLMHDARAGFGSITDFQVGDVAEALREAHETLMGCCSSTAKIVTSAPFRLVACIRIMVGSDEEKEYILDTYRCMAISNVKDAPPVAQALLSRILAGKVLMGGGQATQREWVAMAWTVFDLKKKENTRFVAREPLGVAAEVKAILNGLVL